MTLGRNTIMSLSRRNAASESAKKAVARGSCFVTRKSSPSFRMGCGQISQRAALRDGPYELRTTNHESQKSTSRRPTSPAESRLSLSGCILSHHQVTRFGISDSHGFARRKAPSKPVPCLSQGVVSRFFRKFISSASKYRHQMYGFSSSFGCSISILNRCSMSI